MSEDDDDSIPPASEEVDPGRLRRFARRLMDRKELADDTREMLASLLATSDKAKSELIRMTGREVRHYLDGLRLKEDLLDIATNYKLEVHASFHLEPIARALQDEPAAKASKGSPRATPPLDGDEPEP